MPRLGKFLSKAFACLMILNAFGMGCILQVRAMSEAVEETWSLPPIAFGIGLALLLLPILVRGNERIAGITEKLVPLMSGAFLALSAAVLIGNRDRIPEAFSSIFREAFSGWKVVKNPGQGSGIRGKIAPVAGGILGFLTSRTVRIGTVRGLLSNEAGCGTAPTAHASAENTPADQGIWGIFEVVADTLILCTATALVLLTSEEAAPGGAGGMAWVLEAFSKSLPALGSLPGVTVTLCVIFFGSATVLCWADYASESLGFLTTRPLPRRILLALLILSIPSAALISSDRIFALSDFTLSALTLLNLLTLLLASGEVKRETERWNGE